MKRLATVVIALIFVLPAIACTSAIVSGRATSSGRPILWKHRDTGAEQNFVAKIEAKDGNHGFVALFNGGDSLLSEAWMGMNDAGFAIMNTASYNLMPDTAQLKDREGILMKLALQQCATLEDFERLLNNLPKPMGVQANFGVLDAKGRGAYYETDDNTFTRYLVEDTPGGYIIRTNYSYSGEPYGGYGYIREENARYLTAQAASTGTFTPELFTETLSRSYYHALFGKDCMAEGDKWVVDQDFIPRGISTASIAIEGMLPGETVEDMTMWTVIGYPPLSHVFAVTINEIPAEISPNEHFTSPYGDRMLSRKREAFQIVKGSGSKYVNLDVVRRYDASLRKESAAEYARRRAQLKSRK